MKSNAKSNGYTAGNASASLAKGSILATPRDLSKTPMWSKLRRNANKKPASDDEITLKESLGARISQAIAHFLGTPAFIFWLSIFCVVWLAWNSLGPEGLRFDSAAFGFTALTLMLSLQASYAAPLILLAQNHQADRDKVSMQQDRERAERNLVDTEFLMREIATIRIQMQDVATRDYIRQELRGLLQEIEKQSSSDNEVKEGN